MDTLFDFLLRRSRFAVFFAALAFFAAIFGIAHLLWLAGQLFNQYVPGHYGSLFAAGLVFVCAAALIAWVLPEKDA